jgi:hypothetical protein
MQPAPSSLPLAIAKLTLLIPLPSEWLASSPFLNNYGHFTPLLSTISCRGSHLSVQNPVGFREELWKSGQLLYDLD